MLLAIIGFGLVIVVVWWLISDVPINHRLARGYGNPNDPRLLEPDFDEEPPLGAGLAEKWRARGDSPAAGDDKGWSS
jgi:hypothetical protein